jgi:phosphoribosylamine--glycine ligase|tara:strand:- start:727 stop:2034 length:1308 start_codon:yes stop_codon:yes gene_type:complete
MNILLIGSGAREHALAKSISRSCSGGKLHCIASNMNPGIARLSTEIVVDNINDPNTVLQYAKQFNSSLAVVGPENPLSEGVSDVLDDAGIKVVGPKKRLAQIETSKSFARDLLVEFGIPGGPQYETFDSMEGVGGFINDLGDDFVVKYDGLAGGKGVKVSGEHLHSNEEAISYCQELVDSGGQFVIEEKFVGQEFSLMSFCDGTTLKHMPVVQDHKRAHDGDTGPNTGGMGTYSDVDHSLPFLREGEVEEARSINLKTADALRNKFGEGYKGVLYGGFMVTSNGVKLIEYNARFGDPEAMNVLSLLDSDIVEICDAIAMGTLGNTNVEFKNKATVCKYAVPEGYPDNPLKGEVIDVSSVSDPDSLFFASVDIRDGKFIEAGSRTVAVVGVGDSITEAEKIAEAEISRVGGPLFHRTDIGTNDVVQKRVDHMRSLR